MNKKRTRRMQRLADLARTEERRVCEEMGRTQRALALDQQRLAELKVYRADYTRRFDVSERVPAARWQDYQNFLKRIDQAMTDQEQHIRAGEVARDAHRRRWLVKRQKLESIERVVERFQKSADVAAERKAQKSLDELYATGRSNRDSTDR